MYKSLSIPETSQAVKQLLAGSGLSAADRLRILQEVGDSSKRVDIDYLQCLFFPDTSVPARVPSKFSLPSSLFTHKYQLYLNTGVSGNGWVALYPKDTTFCSLFTSPSTVSYLGNSANASLDALYTLESDSRFIPENFSQARLVGADIRWQYIGSAEQESGIVTGAHVFETEVCRVSDEIIENGYFLTRGRPNQGCRLVWLPKDEGDFEFSDCNFKLNDSNAGSDLLVAGAFSGPGTNPEMQNNAGNLSVQSYNGLTWTDSAATPNRVIWPGTVFGHGSKKLQAIHPDALIITWRGMKANENWIRIDVDRHFEGIPRTKNRDILSVAKPTYNAETMEIVRKAAGVPSLLGQTMQEAANLQATVKPQLANMNSGDMSGILQETPAVQTPGRGFTVNALGDMQGRDVDMNGGGSYSRRPTYKVKTYGKDQGKQLAAYDENSGIGLGQHMARQVKSMTQPLDDIQGKFGAYTFDMMVGTSENQMKRQVRVFPEVYGKSKTKMYDFTINLESDKQWPAYAQQISQLAKFEGKAKYSRNMSRDELFAFLVATNARFAKSMQWYHMSDRAITNAKVKLVVYTNLGENVICVDYPAKLMGGNDAPMSDRMVAIKTKPLTSVTKDDIVTAVDQFPTVIKEHASKLSVNQQVEMKNELLERYKLQANKLTDNQIEACKIGFIPFVDTVFLASELPYVRATMSVKLYYKNNKYTPYFQYANPRIAPVALYGTAAMLDGGNFVSSQEYKDERNEQQMLYIKLNPYRFSALEEGLRNEKYFNSVIADPKYMFDHVFKDWTNIVKNGKGPEQTVHQIRKYNKYLLRKMQAMATTNIGQFQVMCEQLAKVGPYHNFKIDTKVDMEAVARGVMFSIKAYNEYHQIGAQDGVTFQILSSLQEFVGGIAKGHNGRALIQMHINPARDGSGNDDNRQSKKRGRWGGADQAF